MAVGRCAIEVGGNGSEVTVTGVGAEPVEMDVRVGSRVLVGTLVNSSCSGALVRLQADRTSNNNNKSQNIFRSR